MTDYTQNEDYSDKDLLVSGDPEKLILGSDIDSELGELVTAVASKYDDTDIATEAQAIAMASNTTLITPLRLSQALAGAGAGVVGDLIALTDPNADRILFWDDSADAVAYLTPSTGLLISGTTLTTNDAAINHNALLNYVADQHVAHTGVVLTAGAGISGGGDISASRTFALDITELTEDTTPVTSTDYLVTYDASAAAHKKVLGDNLVGAAVGDGRWYSAAGQAVGVAVTTTVVFDTAASNNLQRGTFSLGTGLYTATQSAGARVLITATVAVASLGSSRSFSLFVLKNGSIIQRSSIVSIGGTWTTPGITLSCVVSLAYNETVGIGAFVTTAANTVQAGEAYSSVSIVELG